MANKREKKIEAICWRWEGKFVKINETVISIERVLMDILN